MMTMQENDSTQIINNAPEREKLLVILGPTASGKTELSINIAKKLRTEIISGDSMLVYRDFNIGTAKPNVEEMAGIKHHMIDILPPTASFNLMDFLEQVKAIITRLNQEGRVPMLVGGTGLYIQSLLEGYELNKQREDNEYRQYLEKLAEEKGKSYVHAMLEQVDPETAARLHVNDFRRVIRALEVKHLGGEQISDAKSTEPVYDAYVIGLSWERSQLYERINQRVDIMLANGLLTEIRQLLTSGVSPYVQAMKGIGYKELLPVLLAETVTNEALQAAIDKLKQNSRHFAKRQLTWYRRMPYIHWYQPALYETKKELQQNIMWDVQRWLGNTHK